jgi:hypothetical protein
MSELLFSLSKSKGDFIVQPFKGSGKGGQKKNKTMSACRIIHTESNTVSECQEERSFEQNKKKAFERLIKKDSFQKWYRLQVAKAMGNAVDIKEQVEREMKNIRIDVVENGKWVNERSVEHEND